MREKEIIMIWAEKRSFYVKSNEMKCDVVVNTKFIRKLNEAKRREKN